MAVGQETALDWAEVKWRLQEHVFGEAEYAGVPIPVHDARVSMARRHPKAKEWDGATLGRSEHRGPGRSFLDRNEDVGAVRVRNEWWSRRLGTEVYLFEDEHEPGKIKFAYHWHARWLVWAERWQMLFETMAVGQQAWEMETELRAQATLFSHLNAAQVHLYVLFGLFLESSKRSRCTYVFRKGRPTIVMQPTEASAEPNRMPTVALCHHPLAYYEGTFAGGMVPSDDVLAALLLMRADEARFWREANQHPLDRLQAGL